jgi:V/A-type H+-transporting ATPase subunit K
MMIFLIVIFAGLLPFIPAIVFMLQRLGESRVKVARKLAFSLSTINIIIMLMLVGVGLVWLLAPEVAEASGLIQNTTGDPYKSLAAAIAVGVGSAGAGYAVSATGSAAIGAIAEKPEVFGRALIFVGLSEGVAIYGLIIAFIILNS